MFYMHLKSEFSIFSKIYTKLKKVKFFLQIRNRSYIMYFNPNSTISENTHVHFSSVRVIVIIIAKEVNQFRKEKYCSLDKNLITCSGQYLKSETLFEFIHKFILYRLEHIFHIASCFLLFAIKMCDFLKCQTYYSRKKCFNRCKSDLC